jgi:hypothetical protein
MRSLPAFAFIVCSATAFAAPHELTLSSTRTDQLGALAVDGSLVVKDFPDGNGIAHVIHFKRIDVYAPGARVFVDGPDGVHEIPRSTRVELIGSDDSGQTRVHLAFDPGFRNVVGSGFSTSGAFAIGARTDGNGTHLVSRPTAETLPAGVTPQVIGDDDGIPSPLALPPPLLTLDVDATTATPRGAVVAIDVDHELLVNRFGGVATANQTAATNWIADLFATMNVMYVRDLNVTLQQGTTRMRTGATPYAIAADAAASNTDLNNFGNFWQNNYAGTPRAFAALLSGQMTGGFSASGIAWINSYCQTAGVGGSYSVNKVFTSSQVGVAYSARIVGHELGHNFGASHTHCTSASTGAFPVATGTIDQCYKGESGSGCYAGAVSCPASGPGAPLGSVMSYCNNNSSNGANCGQNVLQFHPVQIATLSTLIAQNTTSGCLAPSSDVIFKNGFD